MRRSKKVILIVLLFLLLIAAILHMRTILLTDDSGELGTQHKVAAIVKSTSSSFWKSAIAGMNAAGSEYNLSVSISAPEEEEDYETQNEMIDSAIKEGAEAIVFSAVDYNGNAKAIEEAAKKGVKIVVIDSDVATDQVDVRIGTDNYKAGRSAGEEVLRSLAPSLNVGIVNYDKNSANGQQREQGLRDVILKDSRVRIVKTINVRSKTEDAKEKTVQLLKEHPEITVIATFNEPTSLGVGFAIRQLGDQDSVKVIAFDSNAISVGMLETGEVDALVVQNPYAMGYLGVECAYELINGRSYKKDQMDTSITLVTKENMFDSDIQRILFPIN